MNLFILFILLTFLTLGASALCNGDLLEPLPLSFASFLLVTLIALGYNGFYGYDIDFHSVLYILMALLIYAFGYIGIKVLLQKSQLNKFSQKYYKLTVPSKKFTKGILLLGIIIFILAFKATLELARTVSIDATAQNMLLYARNAELFSTVERNLLVTIATFFVIAIGYFYTFILIQQLTFSSTKASTIFKRFYIEIIIIFISLLISALGTGRTFLIKYISFILVVTYYLKCIKNKSVVFSTKSILKTLKTMALSIIIFFALFQLLGMTTEKTSKLNTVDMLYTYSGSSIIALDRSIYTYKDDGRFFGEESFYGLYGFLNSLGFNIPNNILHLPFIQAADGIKTNIYTSLRSYIYDFGIGGSFII